MSQKTFKFWPHIAKINVAKINVAKINGFRVYGGMSNECSLFYKRLSQMLSEKRGGNYAMVSTWMRTKISFALIRSCLMCLRGSRHHFYKPVVSDVDIEIDVKESSIKEY